MSWHRFFRRAKWDGERHAEIESYVQIEMDANVARGMPLEEARHAARKKFGNPTLVREEIYRMNTIGILDIVGRDLRYAFRALRHSPMFTLIAVLTLGIGMGANTAIFSVVDGVLIRPLPYPHSDALVGVWHSAVLQGAPFSNLNLSSEMFATYLDHNQTFLEFGAWSNGAASITGMGDPEQVRTLAVTQGVLPALGVQAALGRWFSQDDDTPGTPETVVLTYGYWQRRFGGDKAAIGRAITVDLRPREVIGVMPKSFRFLGVAPDVILPLRFERSRLSPDDFSFQGIARLKPGVTLAQANADVARMLPIWTRTYGLSPKLLEVSKMGPALRPLKQDVVGDVGKVLWVLMGTIAMVLLIACANVANLLLVRAKGRQHELAIRAALGAGWGRIARELFVESITLGVLGGALGLGIAYGGLRLLVSMGPANLPRLPEISIDPLVMTFTVAVSLLSGLLFGIIPVIKYAGPQIATALRGGGRSLSQSGERHRSQNTLVVVQVALALVLLVGSGLMIRSFQALRSVQPGFTRPEQIQTVRISIPEVQVAEPERVTRMQSEILDKIAAVPGVASAAFASALPMEVDFRNVNAVSAEGKNQEERLPPIRRSKFVSPGLFKTQGTPIIAGRDFTWTEIYDDQRVAVISENMAHETWGEPSAALGKRIRVGTAAPWYQIIGVVGDVYEDGVHQKAPGCVYWPAGTRSIVFAIRSDRTGTEGFLKQIQQAVWSVNASLPLASVQTLQDIYDRSMARTSFTLVMLGIAGAMALVLGIIGIYGVLSYAVSQRRREIGIRLALGAQPGELKRRFVRHGLVLAGIGVAIGLIAAAGLTRLMSSLLFGIKPLDPITYAAGALILGLAAVLASYLPARRASAVDPVEALKAE
ncbi:MAG TPA: ABC transporter permease [Bryobacteraceae bacterium]|jgi:predicted permease|nr:ABC transporter permease [Bryobacteraceae bacterium]